jgi:hypothetical protein
MDTATIRARWEASGKPATRSATSARRPARTFRGRAPLGESLAGPGRFAGTAYAVGEVGDLPHGFAFAQELVDSDVVPEKLLARHAVGAQVSSENLHGESWRSDLDTEVLQVGIEGPFVRHDDDEMGPPLAHRLAQGGKAAPGRMPQTGLRGGQVEQQPVARVDESRVVVQRQLVPLGGQEFAEGTVGTVVFAQQYASVAERPLPGAPSRMTVPVSSSVLRALPMLTGATNTRRVQRSWSSGSCWKTGFRGSWAAEPRLT